MSSRIDALMDRQAAKLAHQLDELEESAVDWGGKVGEAGKGVTISAKERLGRVKQTIESTESVKKLRARLPQEEVRPIRSPSQTQTRARPAGGSSILTPPKRASRKGTDEPAAFVRAYVHLVTGQPLLTIAVVLVATLIMSMGISRTNINGAMDVYLPQGSDQTAIVEEVREDWSTDLVVVYVQSEDYWNPDSGINVTFLQILKDMEWLERELDPEGQIEESATGEMYSDRGENDSVVFSLSLSTIIKELNSSNRRAYNAALENWDAWCDSQTDNLCPDDMEDWIKLGNNKEITGEYRIPDSQTDIDNLIYDIPDNLRKKVAIDTNDNGVWDSTLMVFGIQKDTDIPLFLESVKSNLSRLQGESEESGGCYKGAEFCYGFYTMELTGPVPVTNAITERSFAEFWRVFPVGVALAALGIFIFHRRLRAVLIAGVPTLLAVLATYGSIGWLGLEATPTIIALGPILMALGVAYGLHLTNRFTDETHPDLQERMTIAMSTTGKAILLSAVTTMIGFGSLLISTLAPIQTVGFSLVLGIAISVVMTFVLSPAIAILTKYDKKKAEKDWDRVADIPTNHNKVVLAVAVALMLLSAGLMGVLETDIDYLEMAPNDEPSLVGIKKYSENFNAGALGMVLVEGEFQTAYDDDTFDALDNLEAIDCMEFGCVGDGIVDVEYVTAISIIDLFKTVSFGFDVTIPFVGNIGANRTFWEILHEEGINDNDDVQNYLLNVFYDSLTDEAAGMLMAKTEGSKVYDKTLIYVDMPILSVNDLKDAVEGVNQAIEDNSRGGGIKATELTGVAAIGVFINDMLIRSQLQSMGIAILLVFLALWPTFRSWKLAALTTLPVVWVVTLQPLVMVGLGQSLSLVTVMIGSIVIGVGVDFSIHITQRISETDMSLASVHRAVRKTGLSLFEATGVTLLGLSASFLIAITALWWFVAIIMALIILSMLGAMFLLPAMFASWIRFLLRFERAPVSPEGIQEGVATE